MPNQSQEILTLICLLYSKNIAENKIYKFVLLKSIKICVNNHQEGQNVAY